MTNRKWNVEEYCKFSSARALQVDEVHSRLQKLFGGKEEEANEEGVLSPMDRVKYYNLREKLAKVKVAHIYAKAETIDLHYFHLSGYSGLRELILDMVPPSTVLDFISLRDKLVSLEVVNAGIPDMAEALAKGVSRSLLKEFMPMVLQRSPTQNEKRNSISAPEFSAYKWDKLTLLRLRNCGICRMDASLHLFPAVTSVDLSHNQISNVVHLQDCHWLSELDLSYNRVTVLSNFSRVVGNLLVLNLSNNHITNLDGIEKLYALETLNLAYNEIDDENEVRLLTRLPCLEMIDLLGNPISEETSYREFFFLQFLVDGQIQRSGRDLPMLDNEPMTESELKLLRSQLFRAPDDQYTDLSHLDHDLNGNITRGSVSDRESESTYNRARGDSLLSIGGDRRRSGSSAPQRLSTLSDMSMRDLAATLRGDGSFSLPPFSDSNTLASEGQGSSNGRRERSASKTKAQNLHGINNTKHALLSPMSFDANGKEPGNTGGRDGVESEGATISSSNSSGTSKRGSPLRKAKTKYESISTNGGDEFYVRRAKAGRRVPKAQPVVAEIVGSHSSSNDPIDVKQMLQETNMRIAQVSGKNLEAKEFFPEGGDDIGSTYSFSPVKSTPPPPAAVFGSPADKSHASENSSLANTPQIYSLHETYQERENTLRDSSECITEGTRESSGYLAGRQTSVASVESDADFDIGDLGAPSSTRREEDKDEQSSTEESPTKARQQNEGAMADTEVSFEMERSRLMSRDMPLDQRMRLLSVMSSDEGSSRQDSMDSMSGSANHITQLRSSVSTFHQDATVVRGIESARDQNSNLGLPPGEVPSAFLASMAERAQRERKEKRKEKERTPISSLLGTLGMASTPPEGSGNTTPSGTPSRNEELLSTPPRRSSLERESEDSPASRSSKALAAAASLTAKWAAKAAAASTSSPGDPLSSVDAEPSGRDYSTVSRLTTSSGRPTAAAGHASLGPPTLSGVPQGDETIDDFASRYAGKVDYRRLRVVENLELYLKEQVFCMQKGKEAFLYMSWGEEDDSILVKRSVESEVFLACFAEIVHACNRSENDSLSRDISSVGGSTKKKDKKKKAKSANDPDGVPERRVLMVLSTEVLYFVDIDISPTVTFDKAPLLRVIWAHSLHSLTCCTVYFGFQRCLLDFSSAISPGEEGETPYSFGNSPNYQYMIITREKSHTHPIITKIPKAANATRTANSGTHSLTGANNVLIFNKDSQLLDAVVEFAESRSQGKVKHDPDIAHYQMVHQLWRKRPGVSAPRSVVVTSTLLMLCSENLLEQDVKLTVLDSSSVSDVSKIVAEDADASCVTIIFKSASFGITQRKWRLRLKSTAAASKFLSDIRNVKDM